MREPRRGDVAWVDFSPTLGREQSGQRPGVIVASNDYLDSVPGLVIVVPVTTVDRGWSHHVRIAGEAVELPKASWALTEQPRTVSRDRISRYSGRVDAQCLSQIDQWLRDFLALN